MTPNRFATSAEIAKLCNLSARQIQRLSADGVLPTSTTPDKKRRFEVVPTLQRYIAYLQERAIQKSESEKHLEKEKLLADIRYKKAKAQRSEIELQELEGQMHRSDDVEAVLTDLVFEIRGMITALPGRLAMDTAQITTPAEEAIRIRGECNEILKALAAYKYDPERFKRRVMERMETDEVGDEE